MLLIKSTRGCYCVEFSDILLGRGELAESSTLRRTRKREDVITLIV